MSTSEIEAQETPEKASRWEDYVDVFFSPAELFRRRGDDRIAPPLLTLLALATLSYYALLPAQGIIMRSAMAASPTPAQMPESMLRIMTIVGGVMTPITYCIMIVIAAFLMWALARLVDAQPTFREMMIVATYAAFIYLLGTILRMVLVIVHGEPIDMFRDLSFGPMRFVDHETLPDWMPGLLGRFDIFVIWQVVVWAIGFQVITGVSRAKAALVAGGVWLLFALPGMLGGGMMNGGGPKATVTVE